MWRLLLLVTFLLQACGTLQRPQVQSQCSMTGASPCAFNVYTPLGKRRWTAHGVLFEREAYFRIEVAPHVRVASLSATRVPHGQVTLKYLPRPSNSSAAVPKPPVLVSGYVEISPLTQRLVIYVFTEKGAFEGNGDYSLEQTGGRAF